MIDPFFVFMTLHNLGDKYFVWDKSGEIEFVQPGKGLVTAEMTLTQDRIDEIVEKTKDGKKYEPIFVAEIKDSKGETVSKFRKKIYVRLKPDHR